MIIKHIFDGDFGCEESGSKEAMVSVTLVDEDGQESYVTIEDDWLREHGLDVGAQWPEYLIRICEMEEILNLAKQGLASEADLKQLEDYYTSENWKSDFALDEAGELPASLKRGVLSEDGIDEVLG